MHQNTVPDYIIPYSLLVRTFPNITWDRIARCSDHDRRDKYTYCHTYDMIQQRLTLLHHIHAEDTFHASLSKCLWNSRTSLQTAVPVHTCWSSKSARVCQKRVLLLPLITLGNHDQCGLELAIRQTQLPKDLTPLHLHHA